MADTKGPSKLPVVVNKPTPYKFDLGLLLASDPNPLLTTTENLEEDLANTARDGAQVLLNQLLSTCPISSTPNGVLLSLPGIETKLPREKVYLFSYCPQKSTSKFPLLLSINYNCTIANYILSPSHHPKPKLPGRNSPPRKA